MVISDRSPKASTRHQAPRESWTSDQIRLGRWGEEVEPWRWKDEDAMVAGAAKLARGNEAVRSGSVVYINIFRVDIG